MSTDTGALETIVYNELNIYSVSAPDHPWDPITWDKSDKHSANTNIKAKADDSSATLETRYDDMGKTTWLPALQLQSSDSSFQSVHFSSLNLLLKQDLVNVIKVVHIVQVVQIIVILPERQRRMRHLWQGKPHNAVAVGQRRRRSSSNWCGWSKESIVSPTSVVIRNLLALHISDSFPDHFFAWVTEAGWGPAVS
jgi:hypothetical protein